ncbi:hypothetical protein FE782_01580 [Paenibacillus antri]|uniref:FIMAH domain-containing protein n=1 Tax=Paenibacillus antri TaxID=2582848 RepID=A0A5R9GHU8_9BACL|nr:hypothetical protein [Paenibacillus antri]TLS54066.1 hypothetical protein FE782_01580 [Paenibacillus antri]
MAKRFVKTICLLLALIAMSTSYFPAPSAYAEGPLPNLLANPGFEAVSEDDGAIPNWRINGGAAALKPGLAAEVTEEAASSGSRSLYLADDLTNAAIVLYSDPIEVTAGQTYRLTVKTKDARGTIYVGLRYYKQATDNVISGYIPRANFVALSPSPTWMETPLEATAPAEANYARVLLYTTSATTGAAYFDDLHLSLKPADQGGGIEYEMTNLGSMVHTINTHRAAFGRDASGRLLAYSTMVGIPANLLVIDVETDTLIAQIPIRDTVNGTEYSSTYVRGLVVQPDGTVYMAGSPSYMFKYAPGASEVEYVRRVAGSQVFDMKAGPDGILIGGSYNQSEAFEYNTITGEYKSLGRVLDDEQYAYSVAYDGVRDDIYFGMGANARLVKLDRETGVKTEIAVPAPFAETNFIFDMAVAGDKLFVYFSPGGVVVYDLASGRFEENVFVASGAQLSRLVSPASPIDGKVYFTSHSHLGYYDPNTRQYAVMEHIDTDGQAYGFTFAELSDSDYPGSSLVAITREGRVFKYNPQTGASKYTVLPIEGEPTQLQMVALGNDGRMHVSGYLSGGNAIYDPLTGEREEYTNETMGLGQKLPQTDRIYSYKDKIYYAAYPNMEVYEFDPYQPWERTADPNASNPKLLFSALDAGEQDRGLAGTVIEEAGKLVIGTVPKYGKLGGALIIYDLETNVRETYYNVIDQQSVTAVTYKDGLIYAGSNIWGGLGVDPTQTEAKLFIWDMEKREKVFETVPVPGKKGITELIVGPDGNIWGSAEGVLFIFDPNTRQVIHIQTLMPRNYSGAVWRDAQFVIGTDGNVYGAQANKFFVIDAVTKKMTVIRDVGIRNWMAMDDFGNFYLTEESSLLRITIPELVRQPVGLELALSSASLVRDQAAAPSVKLLLTKDGAVDKLERRNPQYFSSDPSVVRVDNGKFIAANPGSAEVWSEFTFNGVTYESNRAHVSVVATLDSVSGRLQQFIGTGDISDAMSSQLTNSLEQASHFVNLGDSEQAAFHLDRFLMHLNHQPLADRITEHARSILDADVRALAVTIP